MQGYCLAEPQRRALWLGLRSLDGVCLALTTGALILASPAAFLVLAAIGGIAGFTVDGQCRPARHETATAER